MAKEMTQQQKQQMTRSKEIIYIAIALLILVIGVGYYFYHQHQSKNFTASKAAYQKGAHNEDYSRLDSASIPGLKSGTGISFEKPTDYIKVLESSDQSQISFSHTLKSPFVPLGAMHVVSVPADSITAADVTSLTNNLANPSKSAYKSAVMPMQDFLTSRFSPLYDITYANAQNFTVSDLTNRAWRLDFSATPKKITPPAAGTTSDTSEPVDQSKIQALPKTAPPGLENYIGTIIMVAGKNAYYYIAIYNTDYNWSNNSSAFTKVINSIKVDQ